MASTGGAGTLGNDEDRLPWLEAVEDQDEAAGPSAAKLIGSLLIGLLAIAAIVGGLFWLGNRDGAATGGGGEPPLIAAESGDYKVRPDEAGGMKVEGKGDTSYAASEGGDPNARIDLDAIPETPVTGAAKQTKAETKVTKTETKVAAKAEPKVEAPAQPRGPVPGSATVQLGAFSSNAAAEGAWKALSGRFKYLAPMSHFVQATTSNGRSLYRLRASVANPAAARELCGRLSVAGESCAIV